MGQRGRLGHDLRFARLGVGDVLAKQAHECIRRIGHRLVPREQVARDGAEADELLVGIGIAAEKTLRLQAAEAERIQEGPIPLRRSALPAQEDRVAFLTHHVGAVGQALVHEIARVLVQLIAGEIPQQPAFLLGVVDVDDAGLAPVAVLVVLVEEGNVRLRSPGQAFETLRGAGDFGGLGGERRLEHQHAVAMRNGDFPVALVHGFGIDQRGRIGGAPIEIARALRHAMHRHAVGQRQAGDRRAAARGDIEHGHIIGETLVGHRM